MLSPSPFSPTARPAKKVKPSYVETSTPASVKPTRIEFGGIHRAAELPDDLVPSILGKLFDCDPSALRVAAVSKLWNDAAQEARLCVRADPKWSVNPPLLFVLSECEQTLMLDHMQTMYDGASGDRLKFMETTPPWFITSSAAAVARSDIESVLSGWLTGIAIDAFAMYISFNVEVVFYSDVYAAGMLAAAHVLCVHRAI